MESGGRRELCAVASVIMVTVLTLLSYQLTTPAEIRQMERLPVSSRNSSKYIGKNLVFLEFQYGDSELTDLIKNKCQDNFTVPPIVHYVWLTKKTMEIFEYISFLSASRFLKPCLILLHGDVIPDGKWWSRVLRDVPNVVHVIHPVPVTIFGRKLGCIEHKSDVLRLQMLIEFGGIYLDTDMYILRSFDPLRNYDLTLRRETGGTVANGIMVARKEAPFLRIWYISYNTYTPSSWAGNSVVMAHRLSQLLPQLVHMETHGMVMLGNTYDSVIRENLNWDKSQYSVHLYARNLKKRDLEIDDLKTLETTFGALSRLILFGSRDVIKGSTNKTNLT